MGGIPTGRLVYSILVNKNELLEEWSRLYSFDFNKIYLYYSSDKVILPRLKEYFENSGIVDKYALTLHTGANLITNYVNTDSVYCYLDVQSFEDLDLDLRQALDLKEPKRGGNFFLIKPYYKKSVSIKRKKIKWVLFCILSSAISRLMEFSSTRQRTRRISIKDFRRKWRNSCLKYFLMKNSFYR